MVTSSTYATKPNAMFTYALKAVSEAEALSMIIRSIAAPLEYVHFREHNGQDKQPQWRLMLVY